MEVQTDSIGIDYTITGIENSEWVKYTIEVEKSGEYYIDFRVAAAGPGSTIKVIIDNKKLVVLKVPATQGTHSWKTISCDKFQLKEGKHELKLLFAKGNFNFNYMDFYLSK
jgi:endoglucanase